MDNDLNNLLQRTDALARTNWLHAVQILEKAGEEHPTEMDIFIALGDIYVRRKLYEKAIYQYQRAHAIAPRNQYLSYIIGNCYFTLTEYKLALTYYENIDQPTIDVIYNKALALAYLSKHQESVQNLKQLLQTINDNPFVYVLLIEQLIRLSSFDEAMNYLRIAESKCGKHKQFNIFKALIYARKSIWLHAYHAFTEYEKESPINNVDYLLAYGNCAWKLGLTTKAINLFNTARGLNPHISIVYEDLCRIYIACDDYEKAQEMIDCAEKYLVRLSPILMLMRDRIAKHIVEHDTGHADA